jgi:hypothetical protein
MQLLIQPGLSGLHRYAARRVRSCPNHLHAFGGFRLRTLLAGIASCGRQARLLA